MPARNLKRGDAYHLSLHVYDGAAAGTRRDGCSDLYDPSKRRNVSHRRDDAIGNAALKSKRVSNYDDAFAFLRRGAIERKGAHLIGRRLNSQDRDVAFCINRHYSFYRIHTAVVRMDLRAMCVIDYVTVGDNPISGDKETTAARELFTSGVKGFDCYRGGFDSSNELGQQILGVQPMENTRRGGRRSRGTSL